MGYFCLLFPVRAARWRHVAWHRPPRLESAQTKEGWNNWRLTKPALAARALRSLWGAAKDQGAPDSVTCAVGGLPPSRRGGRDVLTIETSSPDRQVHCSTGSERDALRNDWPNDRRR